MIAQLMAQRLLVQNPDVDVTGWLKAAVRLCGARNATLADLAGAQARVASLHCCACPEIKDLVLQALQIRRSALAAAEPKVKFNLEARGRLVGA